MNIARSTLLVLVINVIGALSTLGAQVLAANFSPPAEVGRFTSYLAIATVLSILPSIGLSTSQIRIVSRLAAENQSSTIREFYSYANSTIAKSCALYALLAAIGSTIGIPFWPLCIAVFHSIFIYTNGSLKAVSRPFLVSFFEPAARNILFGLSIMGVRVIQHGRVETDDLCFGYCISLSIVSFAQYRLSPIHPTLFRRSAAARDQKKAWISTSLPMLAVPLVYMFYANMDVMIITHYLSSESVAYYSVAAKFAAGLGLAVGAIKLVIAPRVSIHFAQQNYAAIRRILRLSRNLIAPLAIIVLLVTYVAMDKILLLLYTNQYSTSIAPLIILCAGVAVASIFSAGETVLMMSNQEKFVLAVYIIATILSAATNVFLVSTLKLGLNGAAMTTSFSLAAQSMILYFKAIHLSRSPKLIDSLSAPEARHKC